MRKRIRMVVLIFIGIGLVALALTSPQIMTAIREREAVQREFAAYSSALVDGRYADAYAYVGSDFREATSFETFEKQQEELTSRYGKLGAIEPGSTVVSIKSSRERWAAVIKAKLEYKLRTTEFMFEFHHDGERWALFGYKESPAAK